MKVLGIASFTERGRETADVLAEGFADEFEVVRYESGLKDWCGSLFASGAAAIFFVGACGIAVRSIAPFLKSKTTDPAVLVIDEAGEHVISLLSGHIGGANRLAHQAAALLGAEPVITTATDVNDKFAVDVFALDNALVIGSMLAAKEISAAILWGGKVGLYVESSFSGRIPPELTLLMEPDGIADEKLDALICISEKKPEQIFSARVLPEVVLHLKPQCYLLGIGCKKGKSEEEIEALVLKTLKAKDISLKQVAGVASVDIKREEPGLLDFCESHALRFVTYPAEDLEKIQGSVSSSSFVKEVTGLDNICERAALCMAGDKARLVQEKRAENGVTVAVASQDWSVSFEK